MRVSEYSTLNTLFHEHTAHIYVYVQPQTHTHTPLTPGVIRIRLHVSLAFVGKQSAEDLGKHPQVLRHSVSVSCCEFHCVICVVL
jgi:hypothetical protein